MQNEKKPINKVSVSITVLIAAYIAGAVIFYPAGLVYALATAAPGIVLYFIGVNKWGWDWIWRKI